MKKLSALIGLLLLVALLMAQNTVLRDFSCQDAGANDTYACSLPAAPSGYVTGQRYLFKANTANTGAATVNFNSLGAITIKKVAGGVTTDLADNDIRAGQWVGLIYDGTNMQMQSALGNVFLTTAITTVNTTAPLAGGGSSSTLTLSITGAAGQILAGASPAFTATPALGTDNSVAGTLTLANGSAAAHTIFGSGATTTNTINGFATVPTTGHLIDCTVTTTTCLLHDSGIVTANVVVASAPGAGIGHFAGSTQTLTSSLVVAADITSATITGTQIASSIALAGSPTTTTQTAKDNSTKIATTAYVDTPTGLTAATSITLAAPRQYFVCTGTCTITPPVPAAGYEFCVMNDDNIATVITFAAIGSSARYENTARTAYGTAGTGTLVSGGAAGDKVCLLGRDSTHYLTASFNGTWVAN